MAFRRTMAEATHAAATTAPTTGRSKRATPPSARTTTPALLALLAGSLLLSCCHDADVARDGTRRLGSSSHPEELEANGAADRPGSLSHVRLCRAVLESSDDSDPTTRGAVTVTVAGGPAGSAAARDPSTTAVGSTVSSDREFVVVEESERACADGRFPLRSFLRALASSVLAESFGHLGLEYRVGCRSKFAQVGWPNGGNGVDGMTLLQSLPDVLPRPLIPGRAHRDVDLRSALRASCRRVLDGLDEFASEGEVGAEIVLFSPLVENEPSDESKSHTLLDELIPSVGMALRDAADEWTRRQGVASEKDEEAAVINLSCHDDLRGEGCNNAPVLPAYYYISRIPASVSSVTVLADDSRITELHGIHHHGKALTDELRMYYPRANIEFRTVSSGAEAYSRMTKAAHLVCPPGFACLLPSLARQSRTDEEREGDRISGKMTTTTTTALIDDPLNYPWFRRMRDQQAPSIGLIPSSAFPTMQAGDIADLTEYLKQKPPPGSKICRLLRGRSGSWVKDMEYASSAQYVTPLRRYKVTKFIPTDQEPFPGASTYRWEDDLCPMEHASREGMCDLMKHLGMGRVLIVGDSLGLQFARSFWKLMGMEDDPEPHRSDDAWTPWSQYQWSRTMECPENGWNFEISYTRNDFLNAERESLHFQKWGEDSNCGGNSYCFPWLNQYSDYAGPGSTLLIANMGSHAHSDDEFRTAFGEFISSLKAKQRPGDKIMFRTTAPGHEGCQNPDVRPLDWHDEFAPTLKADYKSWHLFGGYNDMASQIVREEAISSSPSLQVDVLDVYPMTVLRPDGHEGGAEGCERCREDDCLHYNLPGPPDHWVHLMYSNLRDALR